MYKLGIVKTIQERLREPRKRIQVIAGPRQVGKTTAVEQALSGYRGEYAYCLAESLGMSPLDWLDGQDQDLRAWLWRRQSRAVRP